MNERARPVLLLLVLLVACRGTPEVPLPDLAGVEPPVAETVRSVRQAVIDTGGAPQAWGAYGDRLAAHGWDVAAANCYRAAEVAEPEVFVWPYLRGHALAGSDLRASADAFARALSLDAGYAPLHYFYGRAMHRLGNLQAARTHYERAVELAPSSSWGWLGLGLVDHEQGNVADARKRLTEAVRLEPLHREAHHLLAQLAAAAGDGAAAAEHARLALGTEDPPPMSDPRRARSIEPVGVIANNQRGLELLEAGKLDEAARFFERALEGDPDRAEVAYNLGRLRARQGRQDDAVRRFRAALESDPDYTAAHQGLGSSLTRLGRPAEAIPHLRRTLEDWPEMVAAHANLGIALSQTGNPGDALVHFRRAIELDPSDAENHYNLGTALAMLGRRDEAIASFREAARLDPSDPQARRALAALGG